MYRLIVKHNGSEIINVKFSTRETAESLIPRYREYGYTAYVIEE